MWGATACSFLNPWGLATPYLQRKVRLRRGWCLCPRECTGLKIWSPKSLRKVLSRLRLGSPREIGMVPPVRIVSIEKWTVNWPRETLGCLNLFLNKFWVLRSHETIINKVVGLEQREHTLLCGRCEGWDFILRKEFGPIFRSTGSLYCGCLPSVLTRKYHFSFGW